MRHLPREAGLIDPVLQEVGAGVPHQRLIYGRVFPEQTCAVVVAQLMIPHPDGYVGHYYGTCLKGLLLGNTFRPWEAQPLGEVYWDAERALWIPFSKKQVQDAASPA